MNTNINTEVTLVITDTVTNTSRTIVTKNTNCGSRNLFYYNYAMEDDLCVTDKKYTKHCGLVRYLPSTGARFGTELGSLTKSDFSHDETTLWLERKWRITSTGSQETVNTVIYGAAQVTSPYYRINTYGYVVLDTPVTQGENEIIDITYRVIFEKDLTSYSDTCIGLSGVIDKYYENSYWRYGGMLGINPSAGLTEFGSSCLEGGSTAMTISSGYLYGRKWERSLAEGDRVGYMLKTFSTGHSTSDININSFTTTTDAISPIRPLFNNIENLYPNYPVSALKNHSEGSTLWVEDLSNLSTGLGYPSLSAPGYTYNDALEGDHVTIKIVKSGNVGVSKYVYKLNKSGGYRSTGHMNSTGYPALTRKTRGNATVLPHAKIKTFENNPLSTTNNDSHGWRNVFPWNTDTIITSSNLGSLGIGIHNLITNDYYHFDAYTTPALPPEVTSQPEIFSPQYARVDNILYVTFPNGLLKIDDPTGTPVINYIPTTTIGVTGELKAACVGYQSRLWVVTNDGYVIYSDDGANTWTIPSAYTFSGSYTVAEFQHQWAKSIHASMTAHEVAIGYSDGSVTTYLHYMYGGWYDPTTNNVLRLNPTYASVYTGRWPLQCCWRTGVWFSAAHGQSNGRTGYAVWNSETYADWVQPVKPLGTYAAYSYGPKNIRDRLGNVVRLIFMHNTSATYRYRALMPDDVTIGHFYDTSKYGEYVNDSIYNAGDGVPENGTFGGCRYGDDYNFTIAPILIGTTSLGVYKESTINRPGLVDFDKLDGEIVHNGDIYRWNGTAWEANYNELAPATADGSSSIGAKRVNFETDANRLNGRSYLDPTGSLTGVDFSTGGLTITGTYLPEVKDTNSNTSDYTDSRYTHNEEYTHTCFELRDVANSRTILLLYRSLTGAMELVDVDGKTEVITTLKATATLQSSRLAVTVSADGTTVNVYENGVALGSAITLTTAFDLSNTADNLKLTVGSRNWAPRINYQYYFNLFKGTIENVQIWNDVWDTTDVANDHTNHAGLIVSASNLVSRYLMTGTYSESHITHAADVTGPNNLQLHFDEGDLSNDSYVAGDWYNADVIKHGILKDNITSFTIKHVTGSLTKITEACNNVSGNSTLGTSVNTVEPSLLAHMVSGESSKGTFYSDSASGDYRSAQSSAGDIDVEFTALHNPRDAKFEFRRTSDNGVQCGIYMQYPGKTNPDVLNSIYGTGATTQSAVLCTTEFTDVKYKMSYVAATFTLTVYEWNTGTLVWDVVGSPLVTTDPTSALYFSIDIQTSYASNHAYVDNIVSDMTITYDTPDYMMRFGDKALKTGTFLHDFYQEAEENHPDLKIYADGVDRTIIRLSGVDSIYDNAASQVVSGSVVLCEGSGSLLFHSSDNGAVITCSPYYYVGLGNQDPNP